MRTLAIALSCSALTVGLMGTAQGSAFPGDNGDVVFTSNRTGNFEIFTMSPNGRNVRQLTDNNSDDGNPSWAPRGRRIVFASNRTGNSEIFIMNADGSNQRNLSRNASDCSGLTGEDLTTCEAKAEDGQPSFSPDARSIVYVSFGSGGLGLWLMDSDGSNKRQLSEGGVQPTWSPNGEWIAYSDGVDQGDEVNDDAVLDTDIFLIRPDGTDKHALVSIPGEKEFAPSWSPSGKQIAFVSDQTGRDQVYVMNIDGTGMRQLTTAGANTDPAWSADGKYIYVTSTRTGNSDVVRIPVRGSNQRDVNLTRANTTRDLQPNSQPVR